MMKYSIVFIVEETSREFAQLVDEICGLFKEMHGEYEVIIVANGTERFVKSKLSKLNLGLEEVKLISFTHTIQQATCLNVAFSECKGTRILSLGSFQEMTKDSYKKLHCCPGNNIIISMG